MPQINFQLGGTLKFVTEPESSGCFFTLRYGGFSITARGNDMAYTLAADMQVHCQVAYVDGNGNPAKVDGDVRWSSSDETIVTVEVDAADSTKALVRAMGEVGQVQVIAAADADLGEGVRELITPVDVDVVAGEAVMGTITPVGAAEPIPRVEHRGRR
jgi:hypothetical protein